MNKRNLIRGIFLAASALGAGIAQAAGVDVVGFVHSRPDLAAGLLMASMAGEMDMKGLEVALGNIKGQVQEAAEKTLAEAKKGVLMSQEQKDRLDNLLTEFNGAKANLAEIAGLKAQVTELEQKAVRRPGDGEGEFKTAGQRVVESEAFKGMDSSSRGKSMRVSMERKDLMNVTATVGTGVSPGNSLVGGDRQVGIIARPNRKMTIRDLLMPGQTDGSSIEYVVETGFTNNAGMQVEGAAKGKSNITFDLKSAQVRTIAHYFKASRQLLDDAKGLASYIDGRAEYGLRYKEEQQFLSGDGSGANILGLMPQASAFVANTNVTVTNGTALDRMRLALLQVVLAEYPSSAFILNPIDWTQIELTKDLDGRYIIASAVNGTDPRMWGLPVVETQAMAQNNFLTGAFNLAAQIFDRMDVEVLLSTENEDDFIKNMCTIRAEERTLLAVYRPEAFVTGLVKPAA
jgi:HK97 family phage major capsid protein